MKSKRPEESLTEMTELVLPQHGNALGTAFGGTVLAWIDICGAIAAQRHCNRVAVTAAIDEVNFRAPIRVGDVVILRARVSAAFRTSLEVEVRVLVEDRETGQQRRSVDAFMTFVALDDERKPCPVPELVSETALDKKRAERAVERRAQRLARRTQDTSDDSLL